MLKPKEANTAMRIVFPQMADSEIQRSDDFID